MKKSQALKKIRKVARQNRVRRMEMFWEEIMATGYWMRLRICLTIMFYHREKKRVLPKQPPGNTLRKDTQT